MSSLFIRGGHIIDPAQEINRVGNLLIAEDKIAWVGEEEETPELEHLTVLDASGLIVCPGFIDLHCHLREPGFEDKETIATGTRAAARGGFTTVCCMPNTNPPLDTSPSVEYVKAKAKAEGVVRVLPIGCITKNREGKELAEMGGLAAAGVVAFSDDGDPVVDSRLMRYALYYSLAFGLPVIDHCEDKALSMDGLINEGWISTRLGLRGIPAAAEETMVARDLALAELTGARLHIAHASTAGTVELIRRAKEKGIAVTAEVTPHHLTLTEERIMGEPWGMGNQSTSQLRPLPLTAFDSNTKVKPPLRTKADRDALIQGIREGVIDAIATDHAPHTLVDKLCEFGNAASGISGLETALGSLMSLVNGGELDLFTLVSKLTSDPAKIIGKKYGELGTLKVGTAADLTILDPQVEWIVDPDSFASKGKNTPLRGCRLRGKVMMTIVGGEAVYQDGRIKIRSRNE